MYIQKAEIKNIRSIEKFEIEFKNPAGWHVLIGDNGAGKSTIIRSIALALVGLWQAHGLRTDIEEYFGSGQGSKNQKVERVIKLTLSRHKKLDKTIYNFPYQDNKKILSSELKLEGDKDGYILSDSTPPELGLNKGYKSEFSSEKEFGYFSVAFGPYRRFEGGNFEWNKIYENPNLVDLAAHLSVFDEGVALTETTNWLVGLFNTSTDPNFPVEQTESSKQLENIKKLINWEDNFDRFLPNNTKLESVNSKGVFFKDGNGATISVNQLSDGYRSILSLTFELIRQLVRVYGSELVFKNIENGEMFIDLPGVVLVDEIDAHLHPTWQTRIGQWFLKYFPRLQFIVTTHSPLVCRAAENGSIWRLAAPGSDEKSGEITGLDRERLIYGNILDAYGTEVFGADVSISQESVEKQEKLVRLSKKKMLGAISSDEEEKLQDLKKVFTTDAPIEL